MPRRAKRPADLEIKDSIRSLGRGRGRPPVPALTVAALAEGYQARRATDRDKLDAMLRYGQSARCRWLQLLEYFGENADWERCGACDYCHPLAAQIAEPSCAVSS